MTEFIDWMFPNLTFDGFTIGCLVWSAMLVIIGLYFYIVEGE